MKILITGGSGMVGNYLVKEFQKAKHDVKIFDLLKPLAESAAFLEGDIMNPTDLKQAMQWADAVVHLAAIPSDTGEARKIMNVNVEGTFNVLEEAVKNRVKKLIFPSSICAVLYLNWTAPFVWKTPFSPFNPEFFPVTEDHSCKPGDMYGVSKLFGENLCYSYSRLHGITTICLRIPPIWHPVVNDRMARVVKAIKDPKLAVDRIWSYVDARDVAQAFKLAIDKKESGHFIYNIGAENVLCDIDSLELIRTYYPEVKVIYNRDRFLENKKQALWDICKAKSELGYKPKWSWKDYMDFLRD